MREQPTPHSFQHPPSFHPSSPTFIGVLAEYNYTFSAKIKQLYPNALCDFSYSTLPLHPLALLTSEVCYQNPCFFWLNMFRILAQLYFVACRQLPLSSRTAELANYYITGVNITLITSFHFLLPVFAYKWIIFCTGSGKAKQSCCSLLGTSQTESWIQASEQLWSSSLTTPVFFSYRAAEMIFALFFYIRSFSSRSLRTFLEHLVYTNHRTAPKNASSNEKLPLESQAGQSWCTVLFLASPVNLVLTILETSNQFQEVLSQAHIIFLAF